LEPDTPFSGKKKNGGGPPGTGDTGRVPGPGPPFFWCVCPKKKNRALGGKPGAPALRAVGDREPKKGSHGNQKTTQKNQNSEEPKMGSPPKKPGNPNQTFWFFYQRGGGRTKQPEDMRNVQPPPKNKSERVKKPWPVNPPLGKN